MFLFDKINLCFNGFCMSLIYAVIFDWEQLIELLHLHFSNPSPKDDSSIAPFFIISGGILFLRSYKRVQSFKVYTFYFIYFNLLLSNICKYTIKITNKTCRKICHEICYKIKDKAVIRHDMTHTLTQRIKHMCYIVFYKSRVLL